MPEITDEEVLGNTRESLTIMLDEHVIWLRRRGSTANTFRLYELAGNFVREKLILWAQRQRKLGNNSLAADLDFIANINLPKVVHMLQKTRS